MTSRREQWLSFFQAALAAPLGSTRLDGSVDVRDQVERAALVADMAMEELDRRRFAPTRVEKVLQAADLVVTFAAEGRINQLRDRILNLREAVADLRRES